MRPRAIVIVHIKMKRMAQVPLAKDDNMIKTLPADRANRPFRMTILPWRPRRSWPVANAHGTKPPGENFAIDKVAIADDVARCPFQPRASMRCRVMQAYAAAQHQLDVIFAPHYKGKREPKNRTRGLTRVEPERAGAFSMNGD